MGITQTINNTEYNRCTRCGYCHRTNTPGKMSKPLLPSRLRFWKPRSGISGDLSCLELATGPSPPHSADGSSAAHIPPSGVFSNGTLEGPAGWFFDTRAEGAMTTARPPALTSHPSLSLCQRDCCSVLSHTLLPQREVGSRPTAGLT